MILEIETKIPATHIIKAQEDQDKLGLIARNWLRESVTESDWAGM